ncbi:MAG: response regulator transcription factor [Spirochaetales bacterium]|nr:response regulator transcription factor [Spirochaetales bacterium]
MDKSTILLVDDHQIFLEGLKMVINSYNDYTVVGEALNTADALSLISDLKPDLAIVDLNLGDEDGLLLIERIRKDFPKTKVMVLSMLKEEYYAERSLLAGAKAFIRKEETAEVLKDALDTVSDGKIWLSSDEKHRYLNSVFSESTFTQDKGIVPLIRRLTNRQLQILAFMGKGVGTKQIAEKLNISTKTVEAHKEQLKKRLACSSSQELLRFAIEWTTHPGQVIP